MKIEDIIKMGKTSFKYMRGKRERERERKCKAVKIMKTEKI